MRRNTDTHWDNRYLKYTLIAIIGLGLITAGCRNTDEQQPSPVLPVPTPSQLAWQEMEFYAFVHFNMNTFTNMEWGFGDESPELFNPTSLDCRQWARIAKEAGMKGIILTAKHHDGFCLWPSKFTEHSVKNSSWKDGQGDVVRELAEACKEYGLKLGIYYSPWDRNHADYGKPEYLDYMRNQLRELLIDYGDVWEVWFDGANGGTGYYGGANEDRRVDKKTYYDMQNTYPIIRELQPDAVIFSDAGPDVRWVGNEDGYAFETMWSNLLRDSVYAGMPEYSEKYASGQENGTHWVPGETNVSIRPGWYYHEYEDHKVKSLPELVDMYYNSIGRNTTWLLNFPVDKRGLIHEKDAEQVIKLAEKIKADFANELALGMDVSATNERGPEFTARNVVDGDPATYWSTQDEIIASSVTIHFDQPSTFNRFLVEEFIARGQRVKRFSIEAETEEGWVEIAKETTIGYRRILRLPDITATAVRLNIEDAKASPLISTIKLFHAPKLVVEPSVKRDKSGMVSMDVPDRGVDIYFTLDGSEPDRNAMKYSGPFIHTTPVTIKAIAISTNQQSEISYLELDIAPSNWKVLEKDEMAQKVVDGDGKTWWAERDEKSNEIVIDLGETLDLKGFTYLPMQDRWISGFIREYEFHTSPDNEKWKLASKGEFGNILNSPILQRIVFPEMSARYIKLIAISTVDGNPASYAEVGILTK